jgi:hypothetical protein
MKNRNNMKNYWGFLIIATFVNTFWGCENSINWDEPHGFVDPAELNTGLPVITINTAGQQKITSKINYLPATITIDDPDVDAYDLTEIEAGIRGRGNYTWTHFAKKPYRIKFSEKQKLFRLPDKAKSWVLLANAGDETMMRNILAFEMGQRLDLPFTNHYIPVEVVVNGVYQGSYVLTEQVQVGKGRVDIDEDEGFLVELDTSYDEEPKFRTNKIPFPVMIKSPETILGGFSDNFVKTSLNGFIDALFAGSFPDNGYRDMIDMDTFVKYIIIQEFLCNMDFWALRSVYLYKDSKPDSKICMGPLWDFDGTLGTPTERIPDSGKDYTQLGDLFFGRFFDDPVFRTRYKELWDTYFDDINSMPQFIDAEAAKLAASYSMNYYEWHGTYPDQTEYTNIITELKTWWARRVTFMNGVIQ